MEVTARAAESSGAVEQVALETFEKDLLIVGPGVLGTFVAQIWRVEHPEVNIVGLTRSEDRHESLRSLGIVPLTKDAVPADLPQFPFVIFCAPPGGNPDYAVQVKAAAARWNGVGGFVFTSSSAVYGVGENGWCDEDAPTVPRGSSPRVDILLDAESAVLSAGGCVVRLAGLYTLDRGAHTFWLRQGRVDSRPDHYLNLIHYEDAASLCVAAMASREKGKVFMGCDNHPVTRQELMDLTVRSGRFEGEFKGFTATEGPLGKRMCNDATRATLNWEPKYKSFGAFLGVE